MGEDQHKQIIRRLESLEKNLEIVLKDRDMLEDIILRVDNLNNAILMNREKQHEVQKNISADIKDVQVAVEDKVSEVKTIMDNKEVIKVSKNTFGKMKKFLGIE